MDRLLRATDGARSRRSRKVAARWRRTGAREGSRGRDAMLLCDGKLESALSRTQSTGRGGTLLRSGAAPSETFGVPHGAPWPKTAKSNTSVHARAPPDAPRTGKLPDPRRAGHIAHPRAPPRQVRTSEPEPRLAGRAGRGRDLAGPATTAGPRGRCPGAPGPVPRTQALQTSPVCDADWPQVSFPILFSPILRRGPLWPGGHSSRYPRGWHAGNGVSVRACRGTIPANHTTGTGVYLGRAKFAVPKPHGVDA